MPETCIAKTKAGEGCRAIAVRNGLCTLHADPARAAEMGRKSGQSRRASATAIDEEYELQPPRTAQEVCSALGKIISDLRGRRVDSRTASTLAYASSVLLKALEVSRLEERLTVVEDLLRERRTKGPVR